MEKNRISFRLRSDIIIQLGLLKNFAKEVEAYNLKRPLLIWDQNLNNTEYFETIKSELLNFSSNGIFMPLKLTGEPSYELLSELLESLDMSSFDSVVSLGGGSLMDIGKGLALLASNPCEPKTLKGFPTGLNDPLPHITVPSVLGSGAEASFNAVFIDEVEGKKLGINSINNFPNVVLVDPLLTMSAPKPVVISSALDCMVHCVDSFGSLKSSAISKMFSVEAFRNVWTFISQRDIDNAESRLLLAQASILAIYGLMNSGDGPTNGFAYYFGVKKKIAHGMAGGMFLRDVMKWNYDNGYMSYNHLIRDTSTSDMDEFFNIFSQKLEEFSIPTLLDYGFKLEDCENLSSDVSSALTGSFSGNPIPFNKDSAYWVLSQQFKNNLQDN